jgi:hypothetical protein
MGSICSTVILSYIRNSGREAKKKTVTSECPGAHAQIVSELILVK